MFDAPVRTLQAGIDYVTVSLPRHAHKAQEFYTHIREEHRSALGSEGQVEPSRINGYEGFKGGKLFLGERYDGYLFQASGATAHAWFDRIMRPECSVARLDLQLTAWYEQELPLRWYDEQYRRLELANLRLPVSRRRKLLVYRGSDGGGTVYCGAPTSEERGRIYDKGVESGETAYRHAYRWEVQLRGETAYRYAADIRDWEGWRAEGIASVVQRWYVQRGAGFPDLVLAPVAVPADIGSDETANERRLRWLRTQVRPAIRRLLTDVDLIDILDALGLE